jgi:hypothetical protein
LYLQHDEEHDLLADSSVMTNEQEEKEKPPSFPAVYTNLVTGRATTAMTSPGQANQASKSYFKKKPYTQCA